MLDLIEHLADWVRAPLLIVCLARPELLDTRRAGAEDASARPRSSSSRSPRTRAQLLVEKLLGQFAGATGEAPPPLPSEVLERAEGNPLFVEETIRMLVESGATGSRAGSRTRCRRSSRPESTTSQPEAKTLLQRASVIGRVFWTSAIEHLSPDLEDIDQLLDDLLQREFLLREPRSSISGESAYRFKHFLIREVAYSGLAKLARAQHHARFAEWLGERAGRRASRDPGAPSRPRGRVHDGARRRAPGGARGARPPRRS